MKNPVMIFPEALQALYALSAATKKSDLPRRTAYLVHLRASQINGCTYCVDMHAREMKEAGDTNERIFAVAAWRDSPLFSEAERAALALTESVTRLADRGEAVPDSVWEEAARAYDERSLAALLLEIAQINFWNRLNVPTHQPPASREAAHGR
jgi:AhpD family alkylhydroperoxidase